MRIDDHAFEQTARAVYLMNESAQERYDSWDELRDFMVSMAYQYSHDNSSFSTGGFQLTFCKTAGGTDVYVMASVSAYVAYRYASQVSNRLDTIRSLAA